MTDMNTIELLNDIVVPLLVGIVSGYFSSRIFMHYSFKSRRKMKRVSAMSLFEKVYRLLLEYHSLIPAKVEDICQVNAEQLLSVRTKIQNYILQIEILDALEADEYRNTVYDLQINHLYNKMGQSETEIDYLDVICHRDKLYAIALRFQEIAIKLQREEGRRIIKETRKDSFQRLLYKVKNKSV